MSRFNPDAHHRRSIRLRDYDYSRAGSYFVTICVQNRECLLGRIVEKGVDFGERSTRRLDVDANGGTAAGLSPRLYVELSEPGKMVWSVWQELPGHYDGVALDAFVVMPNHIHGVIVLARASDDGLPTTTSPLSLPDVVHRFKSLTTARYQRAVLANKWEAFPGRLWQRNSYEHVIRDAADLRRIRQYVANNPKHWAEDEENPAVFQTRGSQDPPCFAIRRGGPRVAAPVLTPSGHSPVPFWLLPPGLFRAHLVKQPRARDLAPKS